MKKVLLLLILLGYFINTIAAQIVIEKITDTVGILRSRPDEPAQFNQGAEAWKKFLQTKLDISTVNDEWNSDSTNRIKYENIHTIKLRFIVCADGSVCNIKVLNKEKVFPGAAKEALRVMRLSPPWIPAKLDGKSVKSFATQSITFYLGNE